jgi:hypothetical protein
MVVALHEQSEEMRELSLYRCLEFGLRGRSRNAQIRQAKPGEASSASADDADTVPGGKDGKPVEYKRRAVPDNLSGDYEPASAALIWIRSGSVTHARPASPQKALLNTDRTQRPAVVLAPR